MQDTVQELNPTHMQMVIQYAELFGIKITPISLTKSIIQEYAPVDAKIAALADVVQNMVESMAATQQLTQVLLGAEALQKEQLNVINRLLDERTQSRENGTEPQVNQERAIQPVALNQSEPQIGAKKRQETIAALLLEYPNVSGREIERRTGIPATSANRILKELRGGKL